MNLRWLWMDHVPPGLDLTYEQRSQVRKLAYRHRYARGKLQETDMAFGKAMQPFVWMGIAVWAASLLLPPVFSMFAIVVMVISMAMLALYHYHRTYRVHVYQALCDLGLEVCPRCGYALHACGADTAACPECGSARAIPADAGDSTTASQP